VSDAPDPFGKRALFWAPAERDEDGPRTPDENPVTGKHALFSDAGASTGAARRPRSRLSDGEAPGTGRSSHPSNRRSPSTGTAPTDDTVDRYRPTEGGADDLERPVGTGMFGSLTVNCSSCRVRSQVDLVEYVVLHLPLWFWRPGRGYTRFMTCPACRRRTWVSATWTSWSR